MLSATKARKANPIPLSLVYTLSLTSRTGGKTVANDSFRIAHFSSSICTTTWKCLQCPQVPSIPSISSSSSLPNPKIPSCHHNPVLSRKSQDVIIILPSLRRGRGHFNPSKRQDGCFLSGRRYPSRATRASVIRTDGYGHGWVRHC